MLRSEERFNMRQTHITDLGDVTELTETFTFNPKEGIDNPALIIMDDAEPLSGPTPRMCVLKREEGESFGFHLRVERACHGHVIRQVVPWGIAERSGLRDGDRLLEVNEGFVDDMGHIELARCIHVSGSQLCFLVLDGEEYEQAVTQGCDLQALARAHRGEAWKPPRLCHISRDPASGLGLSILPVEGEKGSFTVSPAAGGPAEKAGVRRGDRLLWINGAMASELTHSAISKMVKKCGNHMTVLVIDSESEQSYARRRMPVLPAMAGAHNLPHQARRLHLKQGAEGYGFLLRQERVGSRHKVHVLREIDAGSPAELAGIQEGDLLLEVNGESTESMRHEDIVRRVRDSGKLVTLTVINTQGKDFYTQLGLSPVLFCEDDSLEKGAIRVAEIAVTLEAVPPAELQRELQADLPSPRLCLLQRGPVGFGFHLGCVQQSPGTFISQVAAVGPGEKAGLLQGDVVVEVNGQNVEEEYLEDLILLVKEGGSSLSLLVVESQAYKQLKLSGAPITAEMTAKGSEVEETDNKSAV